jgi:hypothetical protein
MAAITGFLGTMAGDQVYLNGVNGKRTYGRQYKQFGGSEDLRKKISKVGDEYMGKGYEDIGNQYNFTPLSKWDGRPFNTTASKMQGGGYFMTVKTYDKNDPERYINCFAYALGTFGKALEKLAGKSLKEIQDSAEYSINHIVERYFENVEMPQDGDLVVYSIPFGTYLRTPSGVEVTGTTHAGIYRKTDRNWNSPPGGSVESKWGWLGNPYVFQHDVFFAPDFFGDQVKFYRLKKPSAS